LVKIMTHQYPCTYCGQPVERKRRKSEIENVRCETCVREHALEKKQRRAVGEARLDALAALSLELTDATGHARDVSPARLAELHAEFVRLRAPAMAARCKQRMEQK
jgi:hypothetical protein